MPEESRPGGRPGDTRDTGHLTEMLSMKWGLPTGRRAVETTLDYPPAVCGLTLLAVYLYYWEEYLYPHDPLAPYKVAPKVHRDGRGSRAQGGLQRQHLKPPNQSPL